MTDNENNNQIDDGGPVYPTITFDVINMHGTERPGHYTDPDRPGISLRDWFASRAPNVDYRFSRQFVFSEDPPDLDFKNPSNEYLKWAAKRELAIQAAWAYAYADAMIAARKETTNDQP